MSVATRRLHYCDFCGKSEDAVRAIVAGPKVDICDECVSICVDILANPPAPPPESKTEAEKVAFAFGWFKALEAQRLNRPTA